jgi:hypothetical protein
MVKKPTKANLKRQAKPKAKEGKFAYRISNFKRTKLHQNSIKSLVKPTICLNLHVLSLVLYECLRFFNIFAYFAAFQKRKFLL